MVDAGKLVLGVGGIDVHEPEFGELERDDPAFGIQMLDAQPMEHPQRLALGEYRGPRIALLLGVAPIAPVAFELHVDLAFLQLGFLQGEDIGIKLLENPVEALLGNRPQPIDVP